MRGYGKNALLHKYFVGKNVALEESDEFRNEIIL